MFESGLDLFNGAVWQGHRASAAEMHLPTPAKAEETFLKGMLDTPWKQGHRSPAEWAVSILVHVVLVTAVVLTPLYFTQALDLRDFRVTFLVAPRPPAAPPPPATAAQKVARPAAHLMPRTLMAPTVIPARVQVVHDAVAPPELAMDGVVGGVEGGETGGVLGGIIGGVGTAPAPPAAKKERILRVGGVVKPPRELYKPGPVYPPLALTAQIQGVVEIESIIDEHGDVVHAQSIGGPPLLIPAALAAVMRWKYEPTYLDGEPVSIRMQVHVKFSLR